MSEKSHIDEVVERITAERNADLLICNSGMDRSVERKLVDLCRKRKRRENVVLFLTTSGGDADVAFRIARYLQCSYKHFTCVISGWCKSAGTLVSLGANELAFGVHGEMGPLDVQMAKKDELMDVESGLTVMTALTAIHEKTLLAFQHFFIETTIGGAGRISVQTASEIAVGLATGLFSPVSEQIDPIHIGEAYRSMAIATEYGQRLIEKSKNADLSALNKIISGYPSHGFVIDRLEAQTIFKQVRECSLDEQEFIDILSPILLNPRTKPIIEFFNDEQEHQHDVHQSKPDNDESAPATGGDASTGEQTPSVSPEGAGGEARSEG